MSRLENAYLYIIQKKIGAGPIGEIYINSTEQVYVVRQRDFFGPLIPQEIEELVMAKYRKDMFLKWYNY